MTASLRLLTIETRRSVALWVFPIVIVLAWWVTRDGERPRWLWVQASAAVGLAFVPIGTLMGGIATWEAGRERRRGTDDLLRTTGRPVFARELITWAAITVWGALAYLVIGAYLFVRTARHATWGEPEPSPIVVGFVAIGAATAIGYLVGALVPSRFAAPLVPIALYGALLWPDSFRDPSMRSLSPWQFVEPGQYSVLYGIWPDLGLPLSLWLLGLTGIALTILAVRRHRTARTWGALLATGALTALGLTMLLRANPAPAARPALIPYDPVCVTRAIVVCVHPAYEARLAGTADVVDHLLTPLVGVPGVPTRAEQFAGSNGRSPDGTLDIHVFDDPSGDELLAQTIVSGLVHDPNAEIDGPTEAQSAAWRVVACWLLRQGSWHGYAATECIFPGTETIAERARDSEIFAAVDRFAALDPTTRTAWLQAHFADLRAGRIGLEDLP